MCLIANNAVIASVYLQHVVSFILKPCMPYRVSGFDRMIVETFSIILASTCFLQNLAIFNPHKRV